VGRCGGRSLVTVVSDGMVEPAVLQAAIEAAGYEVAVR
jgi:hypothetical protein